MLKTFLTLSLLACIVVATGCSSQPSIDANDGSMSHKIAIVGDSFLVHEKMNFGDRDESHLNTRAAEFSNNEQSTMVPIKPIRWPDRSPLSTSVLSDLFEKTGEYKVSAEDMPVRDFVHYIFGDLLAVNYILDESIKSHDMSDAAGITLSLVEPVDRQKLFKLTSQIMLENGIEVSFGSETFFISKANPTNATKIVIGIGGAVDDVPETSGKIMQVVPLKYGVRIGVERTLARLVQAKITPDFDQSVVFIEGSRLEILNAIELIDLLDTPATRSQYVGLVGLSYLSPDDFSKDVSLLLENEGIVAAIGKPVQRNLVLVPLKKLGAVAVFAADQALLDRVRYWAEVIDVPSEGSDEQYFIYYPNYARAVDLGESIGALLNTQGVGTSARRASGDVGAAESSTRSAPASKRSVGVNLDTLKMVVDERANALVFLTSGSQYRTLLPLLEKLDTMPKQILLEITIAEVSLQDEFKYGFEWALSRGEVNITTDGAFGVSDIGGMGLLVNGTEGPLTANFMNSNSLVNVLSNPTLMVRDGVSANINVGSDISVVGQTTQDPISGERQTTTSEYRQTGVDITVTPTVNAQGIVVMEINQSISNSVPSTSGAGGNPDIFERSLSTELVARSGQTVMMAGLVSENNSVGGAGTPGLSSLPLVGHLFKSKSNLSDRTELIMLVTPRVLETLEEWDVVIDDFKSSLDYLKFESL